MFPFPPSHSKAMGQAISPPPNSFLFPSPGPTRTPNCQGSECYIPAASHHHREGSRFLRGGWRRGRETGVKSSPGANSIYCDYVLYSTMGARRASGAPRTSSTMDKNSFQPLQMRQENEGNTTHLAELSFFKIVRALDN